MSGGARNYIGFRWQEGQMTVQQAAFTAALLGAMERVLDWGECGDTCLQCARIRVGEAVRLLCDALYDDTVLSTDVLAMLDNAHNPDFMCGECAPRERARQESEALTNGTRE